MVNTCAACNKMIRSSMPHIKCSKCCCIFHPMCVNISDRRITEDIKCNWVCPSCLCKEPKKDNSNTPVRCAVSSLAPCSVGDVGENAQTRDVGRKVPTLDSPLVVSPSELDNIASLTSVITLLRTDIREMKAHIVSLTDHIKECVSRIDQQENNLKETQLRLMALEERESEVIMCQNKISELRRELNTRAQVNLKNEIEITGVDEFTDESPMHILRVISQKIGAPTDSSDIDYITRVGARSYETKDKNEQERTIKKAPRPLVVRFLRFHHREAFIKASKVRRNLTSVDIDIKGPTKSIYINERLTQENRHLFRTTRQHTKSANYKYCWVKNGTIFIRKSEGNPAIPIRCMEDLQRQFGPAPMD